MNDETFKPGRRNAKSQLAQPQSFSKRKRSNSRSKQRTQTSTYKTHTEEESEQEEREAHTTAERPKVETNNISLIESAKKQSTSARTDTQKQRDAENKKRRATKLVAEFCLPLSLGPISSLIINVHYLLSCPKSSSSYSNKNFWISI